MFPNPTSLALRALLVPLLAAVAVGCTPSNDPASLDPVLADPRAGDVYAAELTHFSAYGFGMEEGEPGYGLMRVVEVEPDLIVANTADNAWNRRQGAINDLRGDLSDVAWDPDEPIRILRDELPQLVADKRIIEARRPD